MVYTKTTYLRCILFVVDDVVDDVVGVVAVVDVVFESSEVLVVESLLWSASSCRLRDNDV